MATNGNINHVEQQPAADTPSAPASTTAQASSSKSELPNDEVGWYFVEQYYTTLSKNPDKLHLYYGKQSQFVYGVEGEIANIDFGRAAIQKRIKDLNLKDCKVRISNVDSQGSEDHIVIQVIGETSENNEEPRKFVQTFVLAQQPSGYFVLNDMLRWIKDDFVEEAEEQQQPAADSTEAPAAPEAEAQPEPAAPEEAPKEQEPIALDPEVVDKKLEEASAPAQETPAPTSEAPAVAPAEAAPEVTKEETATESIPDPEKVAEEVAQEEAKKAEEPKAPVPTPAAAPTAPVAAPVAAEPEKPKEPPKPMSWASRVAAGGPRPVVPVPLAKTATPPAQSRPQAPPAAKQPAPAAPTTENAPAQPSAQDQGNEWQAAGNRRQGRPQSVATPPEGEGTAAYIKYVTEKVKEEDLKSALSAYGELSYFDINRLKNCAFVEFKTPQGYSAAVGASPINVNGENITVEQRRPKAAAYGGAGYNNTRGGAPGRGRGGFESGRSNSQSGGRGGFPGQTRGGARSGVPRSRGAQAGAA